MVKRAFFVALGVPRGADTESIRMAYRKVVTRYRYELETMDQREELPHDFSVLRSYSERRHATLFEEPQASGPPKESEVDRFYDGFVPEVVSPPKARREGKDLFVELRLDSREARRGGLYQVHIPVVRQCPHCHDQEEQERLSCHLCHGRQRVTEDRMVEVTVPPGVHNRQMARLAMEDVGLDDTDLIVHVVIA